MSRGRKPCVGIIYSDSIDESYESKNLAHYFCGLLASTGYAKINMIALRPDGSEVSHHELYANSSRKIKYFPPSATQPVAIAV